LKCFVKEAIMLITEMLARNGRLYADETALIERDPAHNRRRCLTWRQFDQQANRTAQALMSRGIRKGDRVALLMTNCLEWLPLYFGILRTGALAVPLNFRFLGETIRRCVATAEARALIFGPEFVERIAGVKDELDHTVTTYIFSGPQTDCPACAVTFTQIQQEFAAHAPGMSIGPLDEAALYFTSGTTGAPKAALLTQRNLEFACYVENRHHLIQHPDKFLCIPPLYHTGAKMHWFGNLIVGAPAVILRGIRPRWILEAVSEEKVTIVWLLVPWAMDIVYAIESGELNPANFTLHQWRLMHIGAQPVPPSLIRQWCDIFPGHRYDTNYGLTETTGPGCVHLGMDNMHKVGAIGRAGFDWETRIVDENFEAVGPGRPGELAVRGPGVMKAYWNDPEATVEVLRHGWLLTGDIAREDADGFIWLVDRKKDVIITGGENIYPVEIENFLQAHPKIQDVAVIGLPDRRLGEICTAVIQPKPEADLHEAEVLSYCQGLSRYKRPRRIIFAPVPRNPTGKIEKPRLRRRYAQAPTDTVADPDHQG
jgi:acyl-CoA synthetase (AMP-forming)/AMP-acid ligase II